jgi:hypothetical protein
MVFVLLIFAIILDRQDQTGAHPWSHSSKGFLRSSLIAKIKWAAILGRTLQGLFAIIPDRQDQTDGHPWRHSSRGFLRSSLTA